MNLQDPTHPAGVWQLLGWLWWTLLLGNITIFLRKSKVNSPEHVRKRQGSQIRNPRFFVYPFFLVLLVRDLFFQKVLVWVLLGFFQFQKVLVFQLNGFREFLKNYSAEVIYLGKFKAKNSFLHFFPKKYSFVHFFKLLVFEKILVWILLVWRKSTRFSYSFF